MPIVTSRRFDAEDTGRRHAVDVRSRAERLGQARVLGQVGDDPQLDLVVIRHQEAHAFGGHEDAP